MFLSMATSHASSSSNTGGVAAQPHPAPKEPYYVPAVLHAILPYWTAIMCMAMVCFAIMHVHAPPHRTPEM